MVILVIILYAKNGYGQKLSSLWLLRNFIVMTLFLICDISYEMLHQHPYIRSKCKRGREVSKYTEASGQSMEFITWWLNW